MAKHKWEPPSLSGRGKQGYKARGGTLIQYNLSTRGCKGGGRRRKGKKGGREGREEGKGFNEGPPGWM